MVGAIAGDVLGSIYEVWSTKDKGFRLFHELDKPTDDSVLTLAVAKAILDADSEGREPAFEDYERELRAFGLKYPDAGYGGSFRKWLSATAGEPYGSFGNGSAMRASAIGWAFGDEATVMRQAELSAAPTHGHPEGVKGAIAVALGVFLARSGASKEELRSALSSRLGYALDRNIDDIRPAYKFEVSCQASVPEAIIAFLDSTDWVDAVRNAVSLGGDADTQACIAGAIAEAFYGGVPPVVAAWVLPRLEEGLFDTLSAFAHRYLPADSAAAADAEAAARALPRGIRAKTKAGRSASAASSGKSRAGGKRGRPEPASRVYREAPAYKVVLHGSTWARIGDYAKRLSEGSASAGTRLRAALEALPVPRVDASWLLVALLATKRPCIFAESEVKGDGTDWTREELGLLGDLGIALPVTVFDDGSHSSPRAHPAPFGATLLFAPGALLASAHGEPADSGVAPGGAIDTASYRALYERRILPLLQYASAVSAAAGRKALVTVPGLGCGQFAGPGRRRQLFQERIQLGGEVGDARLRDFQAPLLEPGAEHAIELADEKPVRLGLGPGLAEQAGGLVGVAGFQVQKS
jgi:ADP-ribosylglycohydrolase